ncbi:hypothetical protein HN51_004888 [Arachis hypogaea]|uniref:Uncharacterized protein n=2 Tax=Arachis TaxID=3817 RepID=A0A444WQB8_ARAHY|nr:uncharacterized protein LOC107484493 [Arachis duranensis]QHO38552.1 uncharacterized protein DS421_4g121380 [Arachis hypogaea]RYQ79614.1 hypothetical protein Ahy_Scaffold2g107538 [Arachis hypogaea]
MWRVVDAVRRNLQNMKKSSRVADESMLDRGGEGGGEHGWSIVCYILQAPMSILSCVSHPHVNNGSHHAGVWASAEIAQISEMNQLMVNDSMRYAILM